MPASTTPLAPLGKNILLYEPEVNVQGVLAQALTQAGLTVSSVSQIPTMLANDTWLLAAGDDPLRATAALRAQKTGGSCFLLYPTAVIDDSVSGLAKPFRLAELVTRVVRHVMRPRNIQLARAVLHVADRQLDAGQGLINLTEKEVAILLYLAQAGRAVPRDILLHEVWGYHPDATTHTLETHIYRLRQKIEPDPDHPVILQTLDEGYCVT